MEKIRFTIETIKAVLKVLNRNRIEAKNKCAYAKALHKRLRAICEAMENQSVVFDFRDILKDGKFKDEITEIGIKLRCTSYAYISDLPNEDGLDVVSFTEIEPHGNKMVGGVLGEIRRVCKDIGRIVEDMEAFIGKGKYECAVELYDKDLYSLLDYNDKYYGFRLVCFLREIENNEK